MKGEHDRSKGSGKKEAKDQGGGIRGGIDVKIREGDAKRGHVRRKEREKR